MSKHNHIDEVRGLATLAWPVILTQLGQMAMGLVDTYMVGKVGAHAVGAISLSNAIFYAVSVIGLGMVLGLDYFVSTEFGKKNLAKCHYWLIQACFFCVIISIPLTLAAAGSGELFHIIGIAPEVIPEAKRTLHILSLSALPFLMFIAFRQYLQAMNSVKFATIAMILANVLNYFFNWIFVFGNLGAPRMEAVGSSLSTTLTRYILLLAIIVFTYLRDKKLNLGLSQARWKIDWQGIKEIGTLGFPAGGQLFFEVAIFSAGTTLAGRLGTVELAAHSIVLNIASITFMIPLGIASASSSRVGQSFGAGQLEDVRYRGWLALVCGTLVMALMSVLLYVFNQELVGIFISDPAVLALAPQILLLACIFQIGDGAQVVGTGVLRGIGETKVPMLANLVGHWCIGLPIMIVLCFYTSMRLVGLWTGLTVGLFIVALLIVEQWKRKSRLQQLKSRFSFSS
ncbi:MAG: MATE family efflux transporter [Oligoflexia bacterium]|nr:MATE family efflux transporter [Oligoflexia bacterium]